MMCSVYYNFANPLIHRRNPKKTERCKSNRWQCKQLWLKSNYTLALTPGERTKHRQQCRWLGCDFIKQDEKLSKEQLSTHKDMSNRSIMNETKQPSLDDTKSATKNIVVLHKNTPPPKNNQCDTNNIVMLHHPSCERNVTPDKPCTPNASAPNNESESNASTSNNTCNPNASNLKNKDYYTRISFRHLRELEKLANIAKKLTSKLDQKKYVGLPFGRRLLGQAILLGRKCFLRYQIFRSHSREHSKA